MEKTNSSPVGISGLPTKEFIQQKMNVDNENKEPVTDLGLALGNYNQCIWRQLNDDSGAGANAASRIDTKFVASDSLSELVWSPHKGLSLKCADSSFSDKRVSLLWGAGPSNMVFSMPENTTGRRSTTDKPMDEENFITPHDVACTNTSTESPTNAGVMPGGGSSHDHETGTSGNMEEMSTAVQVSVLHITKKEDLRYTKRDDICGPINIQMAEIIETEEQKISSLPDQVNGRTTDILSIKTDEPKLDMVPNEPFSLDPIGGGRGIGSGKQVSRMDIVFASDVFPVYKCKASETPVLKMLESTAENDLQILSGENASGAANKIVELESAQVDKISSQQDEEVLPRNKTLPIKLSPTNSGIHMHKRKGKEKALSDGDVEGRSSKEEDDSYESVESCNSAGFFSTGKKRWNFEEELIVGSKRVKRNIQDTPGSASYIYQDSSFMNWISNLVKGFSKPMQDEAPSLALTLAHPDHGHQDPDKKLLTCNKNQDPGFKNIGFRSIFQSLYCPVAEGDTGTFDANHQTGERSKELELDKKICDINAFGEHDSAYKQFLLSNEKFNESTSGNGAGSATQHEIFSVKIAISQESSKTNSKENKSSCKVAFGKEKDGISSNFSLDKCKTKSAENIDSDPQSEGRTTHNFGYRSDPPGNLWITRFCPKTSGPLLNLNDCNQSTGVGLDCSTDCTRLLPCPQNQVGFSNNHKNVAVREQSSEDLLALGKKLQKCPADTEAVTDFNRIKGHNDQKSVCKLNPILPSPRFKSSEAMASVFARRLDALKHIMSSDVTDNETHPTITCFFCGIKGHHLQECSEITQNEIDDLLRNINSCKGAEQLPCLCIRCFQLNHWAVACPAATSRGRYGTKFGTHLVNHCGPSEMKLKAGNKENSKLLIGEEKQLQAACDASDPRISDLNLNWKRNEMMAPEKIRSNANSMKKYIASSSGENRLKENKTTPVNSQISDVPKGIFDSIKNLRLSRTDILKCMNSHMSFSHLDGFFLRLRLGKREEGLGGTGYFVACITGKQRENSSENAKNPISVNIGGIKCLVESPYVSNHDFLEDELMAWWCETSKDGGKIPSQEDLRMKIKKKKRLGF